MLAFSYFCIVVCVRMVNLVRAAVAPKNLMNSLRCKAAPSPLAYTWNRDLAADEVGRHCGQSIKLALRPAVFDGHVSALSEPRLAQTPVESDHAVGPLRCRHTM